MADLQEYRKEIDRVDEQLIHLFEQRMRLARRVAAYKKEHAIAVLQTGREEQVLQHAVDALSDPALANEARQLMGFLMELSRTAQHRDLEGGNRQGEASPASGCRTVPPPQGKLGFPGVTGSFSEQALRRMFGEGSERIAYTDFEDVFQALRRDEIVCGVLPIENSSTGSVAQVYDLLGSYGFYIVGEHRLRISQNLLGTADATLDTVRTVYSHAQGLDQSGSFLSKHRDWALVHYHNTAVSAKMVAESGNPTWAAIASSYAGELYGLKTLATEIQDNRQNTTRFIAVAKQPLPSGAHKVSISFLLDNESGTLYSILRHFARHHINMVKIESRPLPELLWNYRFFLDFEGDPTEPEVKALLESLASETKEFRFLGGYV